ncbi:hypothetical protein K439DRAFT_332824 [Ramaria rubella]|nr:hypothetical protein K439DRAFT_332824 [Ramaria rubella]
MLPATPPRPPSMIVNPRAVSYGSLVASRNVPQVTIASNAAIAAIVKLVLPSQNEPSAHAIAPPMKQSREEWTIPTDTISWAATIYKGIERRIALGIDATMCEEFYARAVGKFAVLHNNASPDPPPWTSFEDIVTKIQDFKPLFNAKPTLFTHVPLDFGFMASFAFLRRSITFAHSPLQQLRNTSMYSKYWQGLMKRVL